MTDDDLRALVREAVARHLGGAGTKRAGTKPQIEPAIPLPSHHASHGLLPVHGGSALDGRCLIEPAVMCSHCGYCQSYGH
ncbi:MAG: hypothetical protein HYZ58_13865 [Acidobacteria bacterium]|nr:hypothetical protein [Acidobacteriota bacterium]MBI3264218.1 hypothetical protein [Acidobacteriota bacterium]